MTGPREATAGDNRTDDPYALSFASTRRRDDRLTALSYLDAAISRLDAESSSKDAAAKTRAPSDGEKRNGGTP